MRIPVLLSCVLFAASAHAEWRDAGVPGTPRDVQVWAPGVYTTSTQLESRLVQADGGMLVLGGESAGTYLTPEGCLLSIARAGGTLTGVPCMATVGSVFGDSSFTTRRMRHDESDAGFAVSAFTPNNGSRLALMIDGNFNKWFILSLPDNFVPSEALGVLRHGGKSHALIGDATSGAFAWYIETLQNAIIKPVGLDIPSATSIDLFNGGGTAPTALFGTASGLYRLELSTAPAYAYSAVLVPTGTALVTGVDVNVGAGTPRADGFGMAVVQADGGSVVLSAVPANDPSKVGMAWQTNPTFPNTLSGYDAARLRHVSCSGAESCVITVEQDGGSNLLVYRNANAPQILAPSELVVKEGQGSSQFVPILDADGDALLTTAEGFTEGPVTVSASSVAGGLNLQFSTGTVCEDYTVGRTVNLFAADGLARHERDAGISLKVQHTIPPAPPGIAPEVVVPAGTGPRALQATHVTGCLPRSYTWTAGAGAPALEEDGGSSATFHTPTFACAPQRYVYQVRASDSAGTSDAGVVAVVLQPWGEPSAAFGPNATRDVIAGQPVRVEPEALHPCAASPDFPNVDTVWSLAQGATLPLPGIQVRTATGAEVSAADLPVTSPHLVIASDACTDATVPLTAYHRTRDAAAVRGPGSTVSVSVKAQLTPLSQGALALAPAPDSTDTRPVVAADARGLNCLNRRPGLLARLQVQRLDGSVVGAPRDVPVPSSTPFGLETGCAGGAFLVTGRLLDESGAEVGTPGETTVTTRKLNAALGALTEESLLTASCGEGARGTLVQTIPADACPAVRLSWAQVGGPELAASTFSGPTVDVATRETGLDALVGQRVRLRVTADAGGGNVAVSEHEVPIAVAPFIDVQHEMEKPTGSESGLLGVTARLRNTTACGVSEVLLEERLEGMAYVSGSARLDGEPVDVEVAGDTLRVRGVALGGQAPRRFTYVTRPTLLGTPRVRGQVFLREVPISQGVPPVPPPEGCGCSSGSSGAATFGLAALGMLVLRRRRRAE